MPTKIEWTDATWSPVTGCTKISEGCRNCYAERMSKRLAGRFGYPADEPFKVTLHPDRLSVPLRWRKPRRVFVCSMGDLFHENVPFGFVDEVFAIMALNPRHEFQCLSKRPSRMAEYFQSQPFAPLPNVWLGVTAENQEQADKRVPLLLQTPAAVRFVSVEPMLGPVNLSRWLWDGEPGGWSPFGDEWMDADVFPSNMLHWVICGGETGPGARPMHPGWARSLRDQCQEAGVPFFMKQMTQKAPIPDDLMIREHPNV